MKTTGRRGATVQFTMVRAHSQECKFPNEINASDNRLFTFRPLVEQLPGTQVAGDSWGFPRVNQAAAAFFVGDASESTTRIIFEGGMTLGAGFLRNQRPRGVLPAPSKRGRAAGVSILLAGSRAYARAEPRTLRAP